MERSAGWLATMVGVAACNPSVANYCAPGTPECSPLDAAASDSATGTEGGSCDPTKPPSEQPCVIVEAYGIFVSPSGSDANAGTRAAPVQTIGHGVDLGKAAGKRVYVCAGTFTAPLVVTQSRDGASVYGGLDCTTWSYAAANKVIVAPTQAGYALELEGLQTGTTFEDVEFDAHGAPAASAGASSIAVFASSSENVAFERVTLVAGNATDGAPGASPAPTSEAGAGTNNWYGTPPDYSELNGASAGDAGGAPMTTCMCADQSTSTGGAGGGPMNIPTPAGGLPSYGDAGAGAGGTNAVSCAGGGTAQNGADAPMNAADPPNTTLGACSASGWSPATGAAGSDGKPGQGGGGGGNGRFSAGSGGGGACGGCGGAGGQPGAGGGSSIALLAYQSSVTLTDCVLTAGTAGNGGAGGNGEQGEAGGVMGGDGTAGGCQGGGAGAGGAGNGGQGGPGGVSLGIGYSGTQPTINGAAVSQAATYAGITSGAAGSGGAGGSKGAAASMSTGPAGVDGASGANGTAAAIGSLP